MSDDVWHEDVVLTIVDAVAVELALAGRSDARGAVSGTWARGDGLA